MAASSSWEGDDYTIMEKDPTGQYSRYNIIIDRGQYKVVFLGYDEINGIEIAWKKKFLGDNCTLGLSDEVVLLKKLDHENVIKCYKFWVNSETDVTYNIITELYSCNLRYYTKKHDIKEGNPVIKNWCRQILTGLDFLHNQHPRIIHSNLKLENICVVGNSGTVKIGDLNFAAFLVPWTSTESDDHVGAAELAMSEMHSFGACVLQMLTDETVDRRLQQLNNVTDRELQRFIQRCMAPVFTRPTTTELLNDPFLEPSTAAAASASSSVPSVSVPPADTSDQGVRLELPSTAEFDKEYMKFTLVGEKLGSELMSVTLRAIEVKIADFVFCLRTDTVLQMMDVIRTEVGLSDEEAASMSRRLEQLIFELRDEADEDDNDDNTGSANSEGDIGDSNTSTSSSENARLMADEMGLGNPENLLR